MTLRFSGHLSTFCLVVFVLKSLLGIARQWSLDKFAILALRPRSHVRILIYRTWAIVFHFPRNWHLEVFAKLTRPSVLVSSTKVYSPWGGERILGVAGWEWGEMRLNRVLRIQNLKSKSRRRTAKELVIHCQNTNTILLYR